jgi:hypothetical protein
LEHIKTVSTVGGIHNSAKRKTWPTARWPGGVVAADARSRTSRHRIRQW